MKSWRRALCALVLSSGIPSFALGAGEMYLAPDTGVYRVGEFFDVAVQVYADIPVQAVEADISFNTAALSVESVSTQGSFLVSWATEPTFSNEKGTISFSGWSDTYATHARDTAITIRFKALQALEGPVRFDGGALLTAEGQSTNILSNLYSAVYTIIVPQAEPPKEQVSVLGIQDTVEPTASTTNQGVLADSASGETFIQEVIQPSLTDVPTTLNTGDRLIVQGLATPNAEVFLWIGIEGLAPKRFSTLSNGNGTFTFISDEALNGVGTYTVYAESRTSEWVQSPYSETHTFIVEPDSLGTTASVAAALQGKTGIVLGSALVLLALVGFVGVAWRKKEND